MTAFFITATGTGIGKTALTTALCWQLREQGRPVTPLKPVISGYDPADEASDSALLLKSCGIAPSPDSIAAISPWRYAAPLSPHMAAAREGKSVDVDALVEFCRSRADRAPGHTLLEGAGGVMVPLSHRHTTADWLEALGWPVILVAGSYLGAISHTLCALEVLRYRRLPLHAVVINASEGSPVPLDETAATIETFVRGAAPVVKILRQPPADEAPWTRWPPVNWICEPDV